MSQAKRVSTEGLSLVTLSRDQTCAWNTGDRGKREHEPERRQAYLTQGFVDFIHCVVSDVLESFKKGVTCFKDNSNVCFKNNSPAVVQK